MNRRKFVFNGLVSLLTIMFSPKLFSELPSIRGSQEFVDKTLTALNYINEVDPNCYRRIIQ